MKTKRGFMKTFYEMLQILSEEEYDAEKDARAMGYSGAADADRNNWGSPVRRDPNAKMTQQEKSEMYRDAAENPKTIEEFVKFVNGMKNPVVLKWRKDDTWISGNFLSDPSNYIDLKELINGIEKYRSFKEFWRSLDLSPKDHMIIANTITGLLRQGLPMSVRDAFASGELRSGAPFRSGSGWA
jgi:hypothetical protein